MRLPEAATLQRWKLALEVLLLLVLIPLVLYTLAVDRRAAPMLAMGIR